MNTKISALTTGAPAQATDVIPVDRAGTNVSLKVSDVTGYLGTPVTVANGGTGQSQAGQYGVMIARLAASTTVTGTVTETVAFTGSIPASFLTTTSRVVVMLGGKVTTGVGAISLTIRFGAAGSGLTGTAIFATISLGASGALNFGGELTIINNGSLSAQNSWSIIRDGSGVLNDVNTPSSINTANASEVNIDFTVPTLNDVVALYDASVIVYP